MRIRRVLRFLVRLPWVVPRAILRWVGRRLRSIRTWALFFLLVIIALIAYYAGSDRDTPFTRDAYVQAFVVQVAPRVGGEVVEVAVEENQPVRKGDLLFVIDPRPYEHAVRELEAKLALATQLVAQMDSELAAARAEEDQITADEAYAKAVYKQEESIFQQSSTTERKYLDALQKHKAALAALTRTRAVVRQKEQALAAKLGTEHALVAEARAKLETARLNLTWVRVYAPADGFVTDVQLRVGSYVKPGEAALTCIDTAQWWVVANYRENCLEHMRPGQPVGVTLSALPGRVFAGRVLTIGWGVGQGQGMPSGRLPAVENRQEWIKLSQRFPVRVGLDDAAELPLRVGTSATVTVYTAPDSRLKPVGEAWQTFVSWLDYLH